MERMQPELEIEGTTFLFDIHKIALVEKENPYNTMYFGDMHNEGNYYSFSYSPSSRNFSFGKTDTEIFDLMEGKVFPDSAVEIKIPRIGKIDPEGVCDKYGCSLEDIELKSDFEIMVNQEVFNSRMNGEPVTIELAGNVYEVDVMMNALRPLNNDGEVIYLDDYYYNFYVEDEQAYHLFFNISENKVANVIYDGSRDRTDDRAILEIPNLFQLDPIGANIGNGVNPQHNLMYCDIKMNYTAKQVPWDLYGIQVDNKKKLNAAEAFDLRVKKGMLPIVQIASHIFYVDIQMDLLRPKDDFLSRGIKFSDVDNFYDEERKKYIIPYDPIKHEYREIDYETITQIPEDLIVISFPHEIVLDPVGWNRKHGYDLNYGIEKTDVKLRFKAKAATWEDIYVPQKIKENLERMKKETKQPIQKRSRKR